VLGAPVEKSVRLTRSSILRQLLLSNIVSSGMQGRQFDVVLDANLYHCFSPGANRDAYVANLAQLVKPGKRCLAY